MAIGLLASLKGIPWANVLSMSPSIVEGGRRLWSAVKQRQASAATTSGPADEKARSPAESVSAIEVRVHSLERKVVQLGEEAVSSFEVVKSIAEEHSRLAEHHAELVNAVDVLLARTRVLIWLCGILAFVLIAGLVIVASR